jgi:hypothetical protein
MYERDNGHTKCCGREPMLRVCPDDETYVEFRCPICNKRGCAGDTDDEAGMNWEFMMSRLNIG